MKDYIITIEYWNRNYVEESPSLSYITFKYKYNITEESSEKAVKRAVNFCKENGKHKINHGELLKIEIS